MGSAGCTTALLGMILPGVAACGSEWPGLSDGCPEPGGLGGAGWPELVPPAACVLAAQGDDVGGAFGGPVHAGFLGSPGHDRFDGSLDGARAGEHAQVAEVLVAHPVDVALEVAEFPVQLLGFDAGQGVSAGGADERLDVAGVQLGAAVGEPLVRVGSDEGKVGGQVGEVLAGVVDVGDVRRVGVEVPGHGPDPGGTVAEGDDLPVVLAAAAQVLGFHQPGEGVLAAEGEGVAGGSGVHHGPAPAVEPGYGEQPGELDLAGAGLPVF